MTQPDDRSGGRRKPPKEPHGDPYCTFNDDRERRNALVSRDVRIAVCRLRRRAASRAWSSASLQVSRAPRANSSFSVQGRQRAYKDFPPGDGGRSEDRNHRAERRLGLLRRGNSHESLRVVLQTNQVPIAELERNESAKVSVRLRDDDGWHVADRNAVLGYPVLVRGHHGWSPTAAEVAPALTTGRANGAGGCSSSSGEVSIITSGDGVTNITITNAIIGGIIIIGPAD